MYKVECEWDIGQENLVFVTKKKAVEWAKSALISAGIEDSFQDLWNEGLVLVSGLTIVTDIDVVAGSDWVGVYIDGDIVSQGHSISPLNVFTFFGVQPKVLFADNDWLDSEGFLPDTVNIVQLSHT